MTVLYIDIYFLINFTTDLLALYFAGRLAGVKGTTVRLIICSIIGAIAACIVALFIIEGLAFVLILLLTAVLLSLLYVKECSIRRRLRLFAGFIMCETLLGGAVSFLFSILEKYLTPLVDVQGGAENRRLLLLSVAVLFSYGLLKLLFYTVRGVRGQKSVKMRIAFFDKSIEIEGFVDTGNFLKDPISGEAVILIKRKAFDIIDANIILGEGSSRINTRLRLIPIKTVGGGGLLYGLRSDYVLFMGMETNKYVGAIIALDESSGDYNGFSALVPISFL